MSNHVYCIAEFLATKNNEQALFDKLTELYTKTLKKEPGCLKYSLTQQIPHVGAPDNSKYTFVAIEEFSNIEAFDHHCQSVHVAEFIERHINNRKQL